MQKLLVKAAGPLTRGPVGNRPWRPRIVFRQHDGPHYYGGSGLDFLIYSTCSFKVLTVSVLVSQNIE